MSMTAMINFNRMSMGELNHHRMVLTDSPWFHRKGTARCAPTRRLVLFWNDAPSGISERKTVLATNMVGARRAVPLATGNMSMTAMINFNRVPTNRAGGPDGNRVWEPCN